MARALFAVLALMATPDGAMAQAPEHRVSSGGCKHVLDQLDADRDAALDRYLRGVISSVEWAAAERALRTRAARIERHRDSSGPVGGSAQSCRLLAAR